MRESEPITVKERKYPVFQHNIPAEEAPNGINLYLSLNCVVG